MIPLNLSPQDSQEKCEILEFSNWIYIYIFLYIFSIKKPQSVLPNMIQACTAPFVGGGGPWLYSLYWSLPVRGGQWTAGWGGEMSWSGVRQTIIFQVTLEFTSNGQPFCHWTKILFYCTVSPGMRLSHSILIFIDCNCHWIISLNI